MGNYCAASYCCDKDNEEERQLKFGLTPCNSSRTIQTWKPISSRQLRETVSVYVPKKNAAWKHKVYTPEEWSRLTIQKKW